MRSIILTLLITIFLFPISNSFAVEFVDRTGYIPEWAKDMGQQQALMVCYNVEYDTPDKDWCIEYSGYVLDQINQQLEEQEQNFDETFPEFEVPQHKPQLDIKLFGNDVKQVPSGTYVNKFYEFSILPPKNWSVNENAELIGGEEAATVAFYSNDMHWKYTANFIILYRNIGSNFFDLLQYSTEQDLLDSISSGFILGIPDAKILDKKMESYLDGYKITIRYVHTAKLADKDFVTLQRESIVYLLDNGEAYTLSFASTPDDYDKNIVAFRKSAETFFVGNVEFTQAQPTPDSDGSPKCGAGTIEKDGVCVPDTQKTSESQGGGCLIATAIYGTELAPQVQLLREIRDKTLLQTSSGSSFMTSFNVVYYSFSPTISDWERQNPIFKEGVRVIVTPLLSSLSILNYAEISSEQEFLGYGIGIILLNVGMYFVIPAILFLKIRTKFNVNKKSLQTG